MAYQVYLGSVSKKVNSTLQPDYTGWVSYNVVLKQDTDLESPVFLLEIPTGPSDSWLTYNYAYIPAVRHYYWVTDIVSVRRNAWQISMTIDALATFKAQILATRAYVLYGFNQDASGPALRIRDARQNVAEAPQVFSSGKQILENILDINTGTFILSAVGRQGGVATYKLTYSGMVDLVNHLSQDIEDEIQDILTGATDFQEGIQNVLAFFSREQISQGSAMSAIKNCIWLPVDFSSIPSSGSQLIYLGDYSTRVVSYVLDRNTVIYNQTAIPISWPADDWKRMNCQGLMYVPFIGTVGLPVQQCNNCDTINLSFAISPLDGDVSVRIEAQAGATPKYDLYVGSTNIAATYAIGSSNIPAGNWLAGAVGLVGGSIQAGGGLISAATGLAVPGMTATGLANLGEGLAGAANGYVQMVSPVVQSVGTMQGSAAYGQSMTARLNLLYYPPVDDAGFQAVYGHPVMRVTTPVAGYCQTRGFSLAAAARADDIIAVNQAMDGGVFIE